MFLLCIGWALEMKEREHCILKPKRLINKNKNLPTVKHLASTFLNLLLCWLCHGADLFILFIFS